MPTHLLTPPLSHMDLGPAYDAVCGVLVDSDLWPVAPYTVTMGSPEACGDCLRKARSEDLRHLIPFLTPRPPATTAQQPHRHATRVRLTP